MLPATALTIVSLLIVASCLCAAPATPEPERLGSPVTQMDLFLWFVTPMPDGGHVVWSHYEGADRNAMVGINTETGKVTWVDTTQYGRTHLRLHRGADGKSVFVFTGNPGRYLRYDLGTGALEDLGVPGKTASYWTGDAIAPDGRWYLGTYPVAYLVSCDTATGQITNHGRMPEDARQKYIISLAAADDGMIYCAVGLHHREMWAYNPATGEKRQILPERMTAAQGSPTVFTGVDGKAYGTAGGESFLCKPDGIEPCTAPAARQLADRFTAGNSTVRGINKQGQLQLRDADGTDRLVQTEYTGRPLIIYSVACERSGKAYGGTLFPGMAFSCDLQTGELTDLGPLSHGAIQIYDIASLPSGLFLASYMGCKLDFYNPDAPLEAGVNPRRITGSIPGHERPNQWEPGPDGKLYFGTTPAKGRLGGALVRVNPEDLTHQVFTGLLEDQSITYLTALPQTGELYGCGSVAGGSSAIPTQTEASVFLWNLAEEKVVWTGKPMPGARHYQRAILDAKGMLFGVSDIGYYVLDPASREVVKTGELPVKTLHFPMLNDEPVGEAGLIYGLGDDAVFAYDPQTREVSVVARHDSLKSAHGFMVTRDGTLLYGSGDVLWRWRLE